MSADYKLFQLSDGLETFIADVANKEDAAKLAFTIPDEVVLRYVGDKWKDVTLPGWTAWRFIELPDGYDWDPIVSS